MKKISDWSFYNEESGIFLPQIYSGSSVFLEQNTPIGSKSVEGRYSYINQKFDQETERVVDWIPPKPEPTELRDFIWSDFEKRWLPEPTLLAICNEARIQRDMLLSSSDWSQLPDAPVSPDKLLEWRAYRQSLRDVPEQPSFPHEINWPEPPSS